jgi:hypothetical protein
VKAWITPETPENKGKFNRELKGQPKNTLHWCQLEMGGLAQNQAPAGPQPRSVLKPFKTIKTSVQKSLKHIRKRKKACSINAFALSTGFNTF